jgi:hypothetical protein
MTARQLYLIAGVVCLWGLTGCATAGSQSASGNGKDGQAKVPADERSVPPEVTDHTVHEVDGPVMRPTVDVKMEFDGMAGIDRQGIEARVSQQTVRCYRAALHGTDGLEGAMVYEVVVMRSGFVLGSDVMSTAIDHQQMQSCVERTFERLRFDVTAEERPVYRVMVRLDFNQKTVLPENSQVKSQ